jgi:hypothetical protein
MPRASLVVFFVATFGMAWLTLVRASDSNTERWSDKTREATLVFGGFAWAIAFGCLAVEIHGGDWVKETAPQVAMVAGYLTAICIYFVAARRSPGFLGARRLTWLPRLDEIDQAPAGSATPARSLLTEHGLLARVPGLHLSWCLNVGCDCSGAEVGGSSENCGSYRSAGTDAVGICNRPFNAPDLRGLGALGAVGTHEFSRRWSRSHLLTDDPLTGHQSHPISFVRHGASLAVVPHSPLPVLPHFLQRRSKSYSENTVWTRRATTSSCDAKISTHH